MDRSGKPDTNDVRKVLPWGRQQLIDTFGDAYLVCRGREAEGGRRGREEGVRRREGGGGRGKRGKVDRSGKPGVRKVQPWGRQQLLILSGMLTW
jgi:hypothetical protein